MRFGCWISRVRYSRIFSWRFPFLGDRSIGIIQAPICFEHDFASLLSRAPSFQTGKSSNRECLDIERV
jgi:hypothetical protein